MGSRRPVFWLVIVCSMLGACAGGTDERLTVLENNMMNQEIMDLRVAAVEDRLTLLERDLGSLDARVEGIETQGGGRGKGARKTAKPQSAQSPRKPAPQESPATPTPGSGEKKAQAPAYQTPPPPPAPPVEKKATPPAPADGGKNSQKPSAGEAAAPQNAREYNPASEFSPFAVSKDQFSSFGASSAGKADAGQAAQEQRQAQQAQTPGQPGAAQPVTQPTLQPAPPPPPPRANAAAPQPPAPSGGRDAPAANEQGAYDKALAAYNSGRYTEGEKLFAQFLQTYPSGRLAPNAGYWLGECYYSQRKFDSAILAFKNVVGKFPRHEKAAASLLKTGYSYAALGDNENARFYIQMLIDDFPNSQTAAMGRKKLQSLGS